MSDKLSKIEQRKIKKFKLYTEVEFQKLTGPENRQERLLAAIMDDREDMLNDIDYRYLELLRRAFSVMTNELSPHLRDKKVMKLLELPSKRRLNQIKEDVHFLFCNPDERNAEMERLAMEHKITRLISRLERIDPESKSIPDLLKLLDKIKGTSIHQKGKYKWKDWIVPVPIYSDDIADFHQQKTIDISHEEQK